jgi:hypothetical protein
MREVEPWRRILLPTALALAFGFAWPAARCARADDGDTKSRKLDAEMLLELELLSDEHFADLRRGEQIDRHAVRKESVDDFDWLDTDRPSPENQRSR